MTWGNQGKAVVSPHTLVFSTSYNCLVMTSPQYGRKSDEKLKFYAPVLVSLGQVEWALKLAKVGSKISHWSSGEHRFHRTLLKEVSMHLC